MAFNWTRASEEELIEAWKTMPALYDTGCNEYSNRDDKEKAFREISDLVGTTSKF